MLMAGVVRNPRNTGRLVRVVRAAKSRWALCIHDLRNLWPTVS